MLQELGQALHKFSRIEPDAVFLREEQDAGEMLRRLDIHVFIVAQVGQLGPEGDVQGEGQVQGRLRLLVGQDGHGGGMQITGDQGGHKGVFLPRADSLVRFREFPWRFPYFP